ncbi:MAG: type II toxin-antitoxin system HicA family toxin [Chitinophagaceae bacterium]|nr:type II toxin-antitoxin system HicA family toxin [Anaerolineae bacterium]
MRQSPKNVTLDDLTSILEDFGFRLDRISGSHHIFKGYVGKEEISFSVPFRRPTKPIYVQRALAIIDEVQALEGDQDDDDSSDE